MDENKRGSFGSTIGFLLSAIGSAVGLGNIWGFPYKMGRCGGFTFLIVYLALAAFVGFAIMLSELAIGRSTGFGPVNAYKKVSKKFKWIGWLAIIAPFLIMTFYSVLGGYCIYYMVINVVGMFSGMPDSSSFAALLDQPVGQHRLHGSVHGHLLISSTAAVSAAALRSSTRSACPHCSSCSSSSSSVPGRFRMRTSASSICSSPATL